MKQNFKKGAASMYVVVISALLFGVLTVSFIRIIVSDALRTTNTELAQSAYDSALAGVEDAKTALMKYYGGCQGSEPNIAGDDNCQKLVYYVGSALKNELDLSSSGDDQNCSTISNALQRNGDNNTPQTEEVLLKQTTNAANSNTEQAYTCVTIADKLNDYSAKVESGLTTRVVPLKYVTEDDEGDVEISGIRFSWYGFDQASNLEYKSNPKFEATSSTPPMISVQLIQTPVEFSLTDFTNTEGNTTDRGTLFLVPTKRNSETGRTYINAADGFLKSNKHEQTNEPYNIKCANDKSDRTIDSDYACSTTIAIPNPYGGDRTRDTFFLVVSLPYGNPSTDFKIELCKTGSILANGECNIAKFDGVQTAVDSTGRANDMYSRVEARIELADIYFPFAEYALQLSGDENGSKLEKNFYVTKNCWTNSGSGTSCSDAGTVAGS